MTIIISSAYLAEKLREIDFNTESVYNVVAISADTININTQTKTIKAVCYFVKWSPNQVIEHSRWDKLFEVVNFLPDQPICLEIANGKTKLIFEF